jgi:hypothetical protein
MSVNEIRELTVAELNEVSGGGIDGGIDRDPVVKPPQPIEPKDEYPSYVIGYDQPLQYEKRPCGWHLC